MYDFINTFWLPIISGVFLGTLFLFPIAVYFINTFSSYVFEEDAKEKDWLWLAKKIPYCIDTTEFETIDDLHMVNPALIVPISFTFILSLQLSFCDIYIPLSAAYFIGMAYGSVWLCRFVARTARKVKKVSAALECHKVDPNAHKGAA